MTKTSVDEKLAEDLRALLTPAYPGIEVEVGHNNRWSRRCLTFRWAGFAGLLPEERFHRLVRAIPEEFQKARLAGCIWLELAPAETVDQYLAYPRSEDVASREPAIIEELARVDFFSALGSLMGPTPESRCGGDLSQSSDVLIKKKYASESVRNAKLVLIRNGAYCDCQALRISETTLAKCQAGAA
jgi:hypothetical protein